MNTARKFCVPFLFVLALFLPFACKKDSQGINSLTVSPASIVFDKAGSEATITIETNAAWSINNTYANWVQVSASSGSGPTASVTLKVTTQSATARTGSIEVRAGNAPAVTVNVSQPAADVQYSISSNADTVELSQAGGPSSFIVNATAPSWQVTTTASWITLTPSSGGTGYTSVKVTGTENGDPEKRYAQLIIKGDKAVNDTVIVVQAGPAYPSYNVSPKTPDATGMSSTAQQLAAKISVGWNIGNTLEAIGGETAWGNPKVTQDLIHLVKQNGFNAIRIPCSWNQYMANGTTAELRADWLARVKEVVQYCVNENVYVILNIHWDGGWLENNCTTDKQKSNNAKQKAFWEQIATALRDYDEHLLFASANEPNVENATQMGVLLSYHQTFVDAVRSTGGKNSYRVLVVQGPSTDIEKTNNLMNTLPNDPTANKLMAEIHFYTPYNFTLMSQDESWGKMFYYWGSGFHSTSDPTRNPTWGEEAEVDRLMKLMKTKFVDKGIPVIMGEFAAMRRSSLTGDALTLHLASRAHYLNYVTKQAKANGILPFYWDSGSIDNNGSGIFNRKTNSVFDQQALDALTK